MLAEAVRPVFGLSVSRESKFDPEVSLLIMHRSWVIREDFGWPEGLELGRCGGVDIFPPVHWRGGTTRDIEADDNFRFPTRVVKDIGAGPSIGNSTVTEVLTVKLMREKEFVWVGSSEFDSEWLDKFVAVLSLGSVDFDKDLGPLVSA
jgi:hypothetical protein